MKRTSTSHIPTPLQQWAIFTGPRTLHTDKHPCLVGKEVLRQYPLPPAQVLLFYPVPTQYQKPKQFEKQGPKLGSVLSCPSEILPSLTQCHKPSYAPSPWLYKPHTRQQPRGIKKVPTPASFTDEGTRLSLESCEKSSPSSVIQHNNLDATIWLKKSTGRKSKGVNVRGNIPLLSPHPYTLSLTPAREDVRAKALN